MTFKRGEYVAYLGRRAGRVLGVQPVEAAGARLDALAIALTASRGAVVHVPLHRVESTVKRITKHEAAFLDEHVPAAMSFAQNRMMKARAAAAAKAADYGRMGAIARAANKRAG